MNLIKDESFEIKGNKLITTFKCAGDVGMIKEYMYIKTQLIIDRMLGIESN